jgi:hypothetical protein
MLVSSLCSLLTDLSLTYFIALYSEQKAADAHAYKVRIEAEARYLAAAKVCIFSSSFSVSECLTNCGIFKIHFSLWSLAVLGIQITLMELN